MNSYFSTFITGFDSVIEDALTNKLPSTKVHQLDDGLVIFQTESSAEDIKNLRFFNNSFLLLTKFSSLDPDDVLKKIIESDLSALLSRVNFSKKKTFRLRIVKENTPTRVNNDLLSKLEAAIYHATKLNVNRAGADIEFWIMVRKEDFSLFGIRLTSHGNYEKLLQKGELRPELSHLLCLLSEPQKSDIFLDPFAGSGSIPLERAKSFPAIKVLAGDINPDVVNKFRSKSKYLHKTITIGRWDGTNLRTFKDSSVNKIVTDPPWGINSGKNLSITDFYNKMLTEFERVLKPDGIIILLISQQINMEEILSSHQSLKLQQKLTTLVNGQKSAVYKITSLVKMA